MEFLAESGASLRLHTLQKAEGVRDKVLRSLALLRFEANEGNVRLLPRCRSACEAVIALGKLLYLAEYLDGGHIPEPLESLEGTWHLLSPCSSSRAGSSRAGSSRAGSSRAGSSTQTFTRQHGLKSNGARVGLGER